MAIFANGVLKGKVTTNVVPIDNLRLTFFATAECLVVTTKKNARIGIGCSTAMTRVPGMI